MKISNRHRRTYSLAVFCALASVFLILYGCGDDDDGGPVAVKYNISGQVTTTGPGLSGVTMTLSGASSATTTTDASGNYTFTGLDNGSYTVTPSRTGFTFSPTDNTQTVSGANVTGVNFIATPVAPAAAFSQADLTGTWDAIFFEIGSGSGWSHAIATINSSGAITVTSALDSTGSTTVPPAGWITWTISAAGVVSEFDNNVATGAFGQMSSNKQLVIGTQPGGNTAGLRVFRKRTPTTFTSADLANKAFTVHSLASGTDNTWVYVSGTTDGSGLITITSRVFPSGPEPPPYSSPGTISVSSAGIVTASGVDSTFYGLMTDDKKVIFYIVTTGINTYEFGVLTITGQTYVQSDLAGTNNFVAIRNDVPNPWWGYGSYSVDASGSATYLTFTDSVGSATPANFSRVLSASGVVTDPVDNTYHGQLSYNRDITVRTNTNAFGRYGLAIGFR